MWINEAHLYVEKYSRVYHEILLDFVQENEFIYFRNNGDYTENMQLNREQYQPTMILIHNCIPNRRIHEGALLTVSMDSLLELQRNSENSSIYSQDEPNQAQPAAVYLEIWQGDRFARLIDAQGSSVSNYIHRKFIEDLGSTWSEAPWTLANTSDHFELRIWNVGQGSTSSISDFHNLTLFDFGASIYYSKAHLKQILQDHSHLFHNKTSISIILSHWDYDHYNILTVVDNDFLSQINCIFYPSSIVSLTAKQIAYRIKTYCHSHFQITPTPRTIRKRCGIHAVSAGNRYTLYTGEQSANSNRSGLLLTLYSRSETALLTADHSNYQIWDKMYNSVRNKNQPLHIIVPHHGGNCGNPTVPNVPSPGIAAISTGSNNYHHPCASTLSEYRCAHYHLIRTDRYDSDIILHMK